MTITRNFSILANGAGSANTLSLGGATLGSNALAVTGTTALRDITKQADPLQVEWPTPPAIPSGV